MQYVIDDRSYTYITGYNLIPDVVITGTKIGIDVHKVIEFDG